LIINHPSSVDEEGEKTRLRKEVIAMRKKIRHKIVE
jgi:hypothetical protein